MLLLEEALDTTKVADAQNEEHGRITGNALSRIVTVKSGMHATRSTRGAYVLLLKKKHANGDITVAPDKENARKIPNAHLLRKIIVTAKLGDTQKKKIAQKTENILVQKKIMLTARMFRNRSTRERAVNAFSLR